jgi:pyruvate dehydrogenase E2 component (dihydrolipoamide acetyltransferase)
VAVAITTPRLGWSMEEGTFSGWLRQDGERIKPGDPLFLLEGDKAAEEVPALDGGILRIPTDAPTAGERVKVGQVLAYLVAEGESAPSSVRGASESSTREEEGQQKAAATVAAPRRVAARSGEPAASPRARRVARELGVDWTDLQGSGRTGRIRERDVRAATARTAGPSDGADRLIPHTNTRRTIAARMVAGVTQAAPVTLTTRADATNLVGLRNQFKAAASAQDVIPGYTDFIVKLTAVALGRHPLLQGQWRDDGIFVPERIDIALAVDTEAGLLVPIVRQADQLTLRQVAAQTRELIDRARAGRLTTADMAGATFTITNLGAFGIDAFTPIIHLPQCAVLGVGRIVREPAVIEERIVPRDVVSLSLTFDHRVIDGAPAAQFLATLRSCLEQPAPWLMP